MIYHYLKELTPTFYARLAALTGTDPLTNHHASQQQHQHLRQHHQQQPQPCSFGVGVGAGTGIVVDGVAEDFVDSVGRHGDPLGDRYLAEPPTLF